MSAKRAGSWSQIEGNFHGLWGLCILAFDALNEQGDRKARRI
ncbi:MAG TPA: hypothetical protein VL485_09945 [Ktedonobacteraceae bacterium]|nr:hypothetical protein [Ktedonobacteraceae bacterium]